MKTAVIYARYSSDEQKESSIDDQVRDCSEYAERNGYNIIKIYADKAVSGKTDKREEFQKMLFDSDSKLFDAVIVWKIDRFGRSRDEIAINRHRLKMNGTQLLYAMENIPDSPEGIILESVLEGWSEYYIRDFVQKTMRGKKGIALQCKHPGGKPLFGYKVSEDGTYLIDEYNANAVRFIFQAYSEGNGYAYIIDELNRQGYKTTNGNSFGKNSLHDILRNPKYAGVYIFNRIPRDGSKRNSHAQKDEGEIIRIENGVPSIISRDLFDDVQQIMDAKRTRRAVTKAKAEYLLSGKLFCGECGGSMVGMSGGKNHDIYYYECNVKKRQRTCKKSNVKKDLIEGLVLKEVYAIINNEDLLRQIAEGVEDTLRLSSPNLIIEINKKIRETEKKIENFFKAIENGLVSKEVYNKISENETLKDQLKTQLIEEKIKANQYLTKGRIFHFLSMFAKEDFSDERFQKQLIKLLINAVYVFDDHIDIAFNTTKSTPIKIDLNSVRILHDSSYQLLMAHQQLPAQSVSSMTNLLFHSAR